MAGLVILLRTNTHTGLLESTHPPVTGGDLEERSGGEIWRTPEPSFQVELETRFAAQAQTCQ